MSNKFRYLFVSITGEVTGSNDPEHVTDLASSATISVCIDTEAATFSNEDDSDLPIAQHPDDDEDEDEAD